MKSLIDIIKNARIFYSIFRLCFLFLFCFVFFAFICYYTVMIPNCFLLGFKKKKITKGPIFTHNKAIKT